MVSEEFRHLDTNIVLSLVKARADVNTFTSSFTGNNVDWFKELSTLYNYFRWDEMLPWEIAKKNMTIISFADAASTGSGSQSLGPNTLRKSMSAINVTFIDMAKQKLPALRYTIAYTNASGASGYGMGVAPPSMSSAMKNVNNMFTSLTSQMDKKPVLNHPPPSTSSASPGSSHHSNGRKGGGNYEEEGNTGGSKSKGSNNHSNGSHPHPSMGSTSHDHSDNHSNTQSTPTSVTNTPASTGSTWSSYLSNAAAAATAATSSADGTKNLFKTMSSMWGSKS